MFKGIVVLPVCSAMLVLSFLGKIPDETKNYLKTEFSDPGESMFFEMVADGNCLYLQVREGNEITGKYNSRTHAVVVLQKLEGDKKGITFMERKTMSIQESTYVISPATYQMLCEYFDIFHVWQNLTG